MTLPYSVSIYLFYIIFYINIQYIYKAGGANHLSPKDFHEAIDRALNPSPSRDEGHAADTTAKKMVIIDARNIYETRIGRFDVSGHENAANINILDPKTR